MKKEFVIKKCDECGAMVKMFENCNCENCGIQCCGKEMRVLTPNSVDAAVEKHVPTYEVSGDKILVKVNHVMEEEHYIDWVCMVTEDRECTNFFEIGKPAECTFHYVPGSTLYAYCNKHGLWKAEVE